MTVDAADTRFALIADNNEALYPYKKAQLKTGRYGFALSAPGDRDAHGGGAYTDDLKEVVARVVFDGWKVRATTIHRSNNSAMGLSCSMAKQSSGTGLRTTLSTLSKPRRHDQ